MCLVVFSHLDNAPDYLVGCVIQKRFGLSWPKFFEKDLTLKLNSKYYIVANFSRGVLRTFKKEPIFLESLCFPLGQGPFISNSVFKCYCLIFCVKFSFI